MGFVYHRISPSIQLKNLNRRVQSIAIFKINFNKPRFNHMQKEKKTEIFYNFNHFDDLILLNSLETKVDPAFASCETILSVPDPGQNPQIQAHIAPYSYLLMDQERSSGILTQSLETQAKNACLKQRDEMQQMDDESFNLPYCCTEFNILRFFSKIQLIEDLDKFSNVCCCQVINAIELHSKDCWLSYGQIISLCHCTRHFISIASLQLGV